MDKWDNVYRKKNKVKLDYYSTGSTKGVTEMIDKTTSIGFTHAALSEAQQSQAQANGGEVLHIPVVLCGVVPIYNLKGLNYDVKAMDESGKDYKGPKPLNFTGELLAKIYLGHIKKWNHTDIKNLNPEVKDQLPDVDIIVVHLKDSSGTTLIFADYLHETS
jgi:ABC-type phosphate transport system substrate-binding protein